MHFKAGFLAAVAASSALVSAEHTVGQNQIQIHRQFKLENGQTCVTKQPITHCKSGFQAIYEQESQREVEMYCLESSHPMANQMSHIMETGHKLRSLQQDAEKRTHQLPKVARCQTTRLTKNGEIEDNTASYQQQSGLRSYQNNKFNQSGKQQQFQTKQERQQHYETIRAEQQEQLYKLEKLMPSVEKAVELSESDYEEAYKLIKHIARNDEKIEGLLFSLQNSLPEQYVQAVQRIQQELVQERMEESEKARVYTQLSQLARRVYVYTLVKLVREEQKKPISEQMETSYTQWEQVEQHFERLWNQLKREMDNEKIVKSIERQVERRFKKQITEEEKQQLQAWELNLQNQQVQKQHQHQNKQYKQQAWEQQSWEQQQPQQWESQMTVEQRERQQVLLTKIIMAGLKSAEQQRKINKEQQKEGTPLFSGLFNKKINYEQLIQEVQTQFNTEFQSQSQY